MPNPPSSAAAKADVENGFDFPLHWDRDKGTYLVEHVSAQQDLAEVVVEEGVGKLHRFPVAHVRRSDDQHPGEVGQHHPDRRQRIVHEGKLLGAWIWRERGGSLNECFE